MSNEKELKFKKAHLASHANLNSSLFFMICELVDNSISSFLARKRNQNLKNYDGCFINIHFYVLEELENSKAIDVFKIEDNADGIKNGNLFDCLQEGHAPNQEVNSELNNFGVGMKQAVFYIGKHMTIKTRSKDEDFLSTNVIDVSDQTKLEENVLIDIETENSDLKYRDGSSSNHGTIIEIKKLNVAINNKKIHNDIINWLQNKYYNYLKEGLKIYYNYNPNNSKYLTEKTTELVCQKLAYFNLKEIDEIIKSNDIKDINLTQSAIEQVESIWAKKDKKLNGEENFKNSVILKIKNREDFVWTVDEEIIDGIKVTGEIGFIADTEINKNYNYSDYAGLTLYQAGRAIYCPPAKGEDENSPNNTGPYWRELGYGSPSSGKAGEKRRVTGYIDVSDLVKVKENNENKYLKPDSNKRSLIWTIGKGTSAKDNFNGYFKNFFELIAKYIREVDQIRYKVSSPKVKEHKKEEKEFILEKLNSNFIDKEEIEINNKITTIKLTGKNKLTISIKLKEIGTENDPIKFPDFIEFEEVTKHDDIHIKIIINPNSNFLRPLMKPSKTVSPIDKNYLNNLGWIFGITQLYINIYGVNGKNSNLEKYSCDIFEELNQIENMQKYLSNNDFLSILSEVTLLVWSK